VFDVGFSELMVIAVVALIVIGPERLPKVARTMGHLFGRLQRYVNDVKADIQREMELDELRKFKSTVEDAARSAGDTIHGEVAKTESELNSLAQLDAAPVASAAIPETAADSATSSQLDLGLESKNAPASGASQQKTPA
jgi:sec-independent protein translocase protein TatB